MKKSEVDTDNIIGLSSRLYRTIMSFVRASEEGVTMAEIELALFSAHNAVRHYRDTVGVVEDESINSDVD